MLFLDHESLRFGGGSNGGVPLDQADVGLNRLMARYPVLCLYPL